MAYLSISRVRGKWLLLLLLAGTAGCTGGGEKVHTSDSTGVQAGGQNEAGGSKLTKALTLPDGTRVLMDPRTVILPSEGFGKDNRELKLDGEALFTVSSGGSKPFIVHTRNLNLMAMGARFHVDAFASSAGEEVDLLEGKLKVSKSYHSSTDNEVENLVAGEMVMINRDIDLMEKEKLNPAELKALEEKIHFPSDSIPLSSDPIPHN